jgi:phosphohistidine phosphatase SixA
MEYASALRALAMFSITASMTLLPTPARAQQLQGKALVKALQQGGYVIVMRHASSPAEKPDKQLADPENIKAERQLDELGRNSATAFGKALRDLKIPIGEVLSSPTYRALETAHYAQLPDPRIVPELGDNPQPPQDASQSMRASSQRQKVWLEMEVGRFLKGSNAIIITHMPNIAAAFPAESVGFSDGEAIIFGPGVKGIATPLARVKINEWPKLTAR